MENKSTVELHEELASREGVTEIVIGPYETFQIVQDQRTHEFTGPATVKIKQENFVKVNLNNFDFTDVKDKLLYEKLKSENPIEAIRQLEEILRTQKIII